MALMKRTASQEKMARMIHERAVDLERGGHKISSTAAEKGVEVSRNIADILRRTADDIRNIRQDSIGGKMMVAMDSARDTMDRSTQAMKTNIREHPLASVAMAIGMGFIIGAALSAARSRRARRILYEE